MKEKAVWGLILFLLAIALILPTAEALQSRGPIYIHGNKDFTSVNGIIGGKGTPDDPYIIEGWYIIGSENYGTETGGYGIFIQNTTAHFVIKNCVVQKYLFGIGFSNVRNGKIYNVTLYDNGIGILLMRADFNNISSNKIYNNKGGILLINSLGNIITSNDVYNNSRGGIALESYSSNNKIYLNNFNNPQNVYLETHYKNFWNSSEKLTYVYDGKTFENYLGNYWGDYRRNDSDGDGIGDIYYTIGPNDVDYRPLIKPWAQTPTPTPKPTPGFGTIFAIAGLIVIAYLLRKE